MEQQRQLFAEGDRADLIFVLELRFGPLPEELIAELAAVRDPDQLNRLILVGANAPTLEGFRKEIGSEEDFRILSESFEVKPKQGE